MSIFTKQQIKDAAIFSNFCQEMKSMFWSKCITNDDLKKKGLFEIPTESELDDIALHLYNKYMNKDKP